MPAEAGAFFSNSMILQVDKFEKVVCHGHLPNTDCGSIVSGGAFLDLTKNVCYGALAATLRADDQNF